MLKAKFMADKQERNIDTRVPVRGLQMVWTCACINLLINCYFVLCCMLILMCTFLGLSQTADWQAQDSYL